MLSPGVDKFNETQVSIPVGWWISDEDKSNRGKNKRFSSLCTKKGSKIINYLSGENVILQSSLKKITDKKG